MNVSIAENEPSSGTVTSPLKIMDMKETESSRSAIALTVERLSRI